MNQKHSKNSSYDQNISSVHNFSPPLIKKEIKELEINKLSPCFNPENFSILNHGYNTCTNYNNYEGIPKNI